MRAKPNMRDGTITLCLCSVGKSAKNASRLHLLYVYPSREGRIHEKLLNAIEAVPLLECDAADGLYPR